MGTALSNMRLPWWLSGGESACQHRRRGFDPWVRKIPWRRKWPPIPVLLPGKSCGQRSLAGCSPGGHKTVREDLATKQELRNRRDMKKPRSLRTSSFMAKISYLALNLFTYKYDYCLSPISKY